MKPLTLAISLALSVGSSAVFAQMTDNVSEQKPDKMVTPMVPLTYVGSNARVGATIDTDGDFSGEVLGILGFTGTSAVLAEGWLGNGGAGGVQLGYNWLWGVKDKQAAIDDPNSMVVAKVFAAFDRNSESDRKVTLGIGAEKNDVFFTGYVSKGLSDERLTRTANSVFNDTLGGTQNGRPFTQTRSVNTIFEQFEKGYDRALGLRLGKYYDSNLLRLRGGLDFANGDQSTDQLTASVGVDKYFEGTGHSLSLDVSHASKGLADAPTNASFAALQNNFNSDDNDTVAALTYRYSFGESYRPAAWEHAVSNPIPDSPPTKAAPEIERVAMETKADLDSDSFFDFDKSGLRGETQAELDRLVGVIKAAKLASPVTITGHTCSIGTDAYNIGLSNRRANAVADYFKAAGIETELVVEGKGEADPTYPNDTAESRKKNRRVDVAFITVEEKFDERTLAATDGGVTYSRQIVSVPPGWIERALRNPGEHRRNVDTYTVVKTRQETTLGPVVFTNRAPTAVNDVIRLSRNAGATLIPVLVNDSDLDGDTLTVTSVTAPTNGTTSNSGNGVLYTPRTGFVGTDTFSYTVSDGKGGSATATVTVTVADQAPVAVDDVATVFSGASVTVSPLANDRDPEGGVLRVTGIDQPASGTAVLEGNNVRYTAAAGFVGTATIPYRIVDDAGNVANARIIVTVQAAPANRPPTARDDMAMVMAGMTVDVNVLANDTDPDAGDVLRVTAVGASMLGGATSINANGTVRYISRVGAMGMDMFSYTITDSAGNTATAQISVTIGMNPGD